MSDKARIVFPTDFSDASMAALVWLRRHNWQDQAEIHCINVVQRPMIYMPMMSGTASESIPSIAELERMAGESMDKFIDKHMSDFGQRPVTKILTGRPADEINKYAKAIDADMIVIASRGHSEIAHLLLGSTAEGVVRHADCAVVTVRV